MSAAAVRVTRQARREGLADLLTEYSAMQPGPRFRFRAGYTNGRHRTTAMLDAGVRRTVIVRWRYPR